MKHSPDFNRIQPDQAVAMCTCEQALQLAEYDHYRVMVSGRAGLLLTKEWFPLEEHNGPFVLTVIFHHIEDLPLVPEHVQTLIDGLKFQVRGQPR